MIKNIFFFACVLAGMACTSQSKDEFTVKVNWINLSLVQYIWDI